jgi:hypothetical protein
MITEKELSEQFSNKSFLEKKFHLFPFCSHSGQAYDPTQLHVRAAPVPRLLLFFS